MCYESRPAKFTLMESVFDAAALFFGPAGQNLQAPEEFVLEPQSDFLHHAPRSEVHDERSCADLLIPPFAESAVEQGTRAFRRQAAAPNTPLETISQLHLLRLDFVRSQMKPADEFISIVQVAEPKSLGWRLLIIAEHPRHVFILDARERSGLAFGDEPHHFRVAIQLEQQRRILRVEPAQINALGFK